MKKVWTTKALHCQRSRVYMAREKTPTHLLQFKAGDIISLVKITNGISQQSLCSNVKLRVSSEISHGEIILNVDSDMYSKDSESVKDAVLCFFMVEEKGHEFHSYNSPKTSITSLRMTSMAISCNWWWWRRWVKNTIKVLLLDIQFIRLHNHRFWNAKWYGHVVILSQW